MKREKRPQYIFQKILDRQVKYRIDSHIYCSSWTFMTLFFRKILEQAVIGKYHVRIVSKRLAPFADSVDDMRSFLRTGTLQLYVTDGRIEDERNPFIDVVRDSPNGALFFGPKAEPSFLMESIVAGPMYWIGGNDCPAGNFNDPEFAKMICWRIDDLCLMRWRRLVKRI